MDVSSKSAFDFSRLHADYAGMEETLLSLVGEFKLQAPLMLLQLKKAILAKNHKSIEIAAHTLKSAVSYLHAEKARALAFEIEKIGKSRDLSALLNQPDDLEAEVMLLLAAIESESWEKKVG